MTQGASHTRSDEAAVHEAAAGWFMALRAGEITADDPAYRAWIDADSTHAEAMIAVQDIWGALDEHAGAPEMMAARRDALSRSTRAAAARWRLGDSGNRGPLWAAAAAALVLVVAAPLWFAAQTGSDDAGVETAAPLLAFETDIAETRVVTLADNSRVSLDAATRLTVDYSADARWIELVRGQAHFDVATDPTRPFTVRAGDQTVVATGTAFNVEIVEGDVVVTLIEGEVVVTAASTEATPSATPAAPTELEPEAARVLRPGQQLIASGETQQAEVFSDTNLHKTTAWRRGDVMFEDDPLSIAVARMNRYSRIELRVVGEELDVLRVSGVFDAGDTDAFVEAIEAYFPVDARRMSASAIELHARDAG